MDRVKIPTREQSLTLPLDVAARQKSFEQIFTSRQDSVPKVVYNVDREDLFSR